ncbi:hypothetical protein PR048_029536 [Dryococelus australis]|uniref:Uncharacterized protein n=1 Tax=Dryococelus australis TaxID=614101 RepID=A0ABQ9GE01_9NEOP|nr:hypothetical protein PR048_029536 [Dryococelus australis]
MKGRGKQDIPEKTRWPAASCDAIPTCGNPGVTRPGIEPGSPWWEASRLTAQRPRPPGRRRLEPRAGYISALLVGEVLLPVLPRAQSGDITIADLGGCLWTVRLAHLLTCTAEPSASLRASSRRLALDLSPNPECWIELQIFTNGTENSAGQCRWSAGFLEALPFSPIPRRTAVLVEIASLAKHSVSQFKRLVDARFNAVFMFLSKYRPLTVTSNISEVLLTGYSSASCKQNTTRLPPMANRVRFSRMFTCGMPLFGMFSRGSPMSSAFEFRRCFIDLEVLARGGRADRRGLSGRVTCEGGGGSFLPSPHLTGTPPLHLVPVAADP